MLNPYVDIVSTTFDGRLPVDAIAFSLPGMFAILAVGLAGIVIALGTALTAAPLLWVMTAVFLFFAPSPSRRGGTVNTRRPDRGRDRFGRIRRQWSRRSLRAKARGASRRVEHLATNRQPYGLGVVRGADRRVGDLPEI